MSLAYVGVALLPGIAGPAYFTPTAAVAALLAAGLALRSYAPAPALGAFALWSAIAAGAAEAPFLGLGAVVGAAAVATGAGALAVEDRAVRDEALRALAVAAAVAGVAAAAERVVLGGAGVGRASLWYASPNDLGLFLAAGALAAPAWGGWRGAALAAAAAVGVAATASRGAVLALAAGGAVLLRHGRPARRCGVILAGGMIAAILAAAVVGGAAARAMAEPLAWSRPRIWAAALGMAAARPIVGVGPGAFASRWPAHAPPATNEPLRWGAVASHGHGEFFHAAAETGLVGAALLAAASVGAASAARRSASPALAPIVGWAAAACATQVWTGPLAGLSALLAGAAGPKGRAFPVRGWPLPLAVVVGAGVILAADVSARLGAPAVAAAIHPGRIGDHLRAGDPVEAIRRDPARAYLRENLAGTDPLAYRSAVARAPFDPPLRWRAARQAERLGRDPRPDLAVAAALEPAFTAAERRRADLEADPRRREARRAGAALAEALLDARAAALYPRYVQALRDPS